MASVPKQFWCHMCDDWTAVTEMADNPEDFWCSVCHEAYQCCECGCEIDRVGYCQRPLEDGVLCPETKEAQENAHGLKK